MEELFWSCLAFGVLFTLVSVVLGDLVSHALGGALDFMSVDYLNPTTLAIAITVFGGSGIMLSRYTPLPGFASLAGALALAGGIGFLAAKYYVKPLKNTESSTAYSMQGLTGRLGEVLTSIPAGDGCGEVLLKVGAGHSNHIASSFDGNAIQSGVRVVVVQVKDGVLYVSRFENKE
ncbi:protease [Gorillibacterium sp. sgz5001074]|uniref:protease n=1 Tax=Gorillibacterium sp. sgz5001074 TaxID=3446695 RepID=UPI003F6713FA